MAACFYKMSSRFLWCQVNSIPAFLQMNHRHDLVQDNRWVSHVYVLEVSSEFMQNPCLLFEVQLNLLLCSSQNLEIFL